MRTNQPASCSCVRSYIYHRISSGMTSFWLCLKLDKRDWHYSMCEAMTTLIHSLLCIFFNPLPHVYTLRLPFMSVYVCFLCVCVWFGRLSRWSSLSVADTDPENHGVWGGQESAAQPTNGRPCQAGRRPRVGGGGGGGGGGCGGGREGGATTTLILFYLFFLNSSTRVTLGGGPPNFTLVSSRNRNKPGKQNTSSGNKKKNSGVCFSFKGDGVLFILHLFYVFCWVFFFEPQVRDCILQPSSCKNKTHSSTLPQIQSSSVISSLLIKELMEAAGWGGWGLEGAKPSHHHPPPPLHNPFAQPTPPPAHTHTHTGTLAHTIHSTRIHSPPPPPYTLLPWFPWRLLSPKLR